LDAIGDEFTAPYDAPTSERSHPVLFLASRHVARAAGNIGPLDSRDRSQMAIDGAPDFSHRCPFLARRQQGASKAQEENRRIFCHTQLG